MRKRFLAILEIDDDVNPGRERLGERLQTAFDRAWPFARMGSVRLAELVGLADELDVPYAYAVLPSRSGAV